MTITKNINENSFARFILWIYAVCLLVNAVVTKMAYDETLGYQGVAGVWLGAALIWYGPLRARMEQRFK